MRKRDSIAYYKYKKSRMSTVTNREFRLAVAAKREEQRQEDERLTDES